ncbi:MAG: alpha/beta fold hydrolase [Actinomycetota bacterium]|nr:alpha/beta fold hydrolase [Actinomycetota bacterium]MDD5667305.1 alpha/beta fold hydrolase [Actinomycetota bacterium]
MLERELTWKADGVTLRGAVALSSRGGRLPLVVLCHGIPSGVPVTGEPGYEVLARRLAEEGCAACYFNFRGTGLSEGDFSLGGWLSDLESLLDEAREGRSAFERCDPGRTALVGFSGGGAVSINCAARRRGLAGVVSLSSPADFSRIMTREGIKDFIAHARAIGIIRDPGFPSDEEAYYRDMLDSSPIGMVSAVSPTPLLFIHGDEDDTVPVDEARRLYEAASEPRELLIVRGGGHKLRQNAEAMDRAIAWVLELLGTG